MGKKNELPSLPVDASDEEDAAIENVPGVMLEFPHAPSREGHVASRVEISRMTITQITGLHLLVSSLDNNKATLADGRRVVTAVDSVRWLLERIAGQRPTGWKPQGF